MKIYFFIMSVLMMFNLSACAENPAFICVGSMDNLKTGESIKINQNVVFAPGAGYIIQTLVYIPNFYDLFITGDSDGSAKIYVQRSSNGMMETMASLQIMKETKLTIFVHRDDKVEVDVRCARVL